MKQIHPNSQLVQILNDNQNKKLLEQSKAKHSYWLGVLKNFCASILIIICVGSAVTMAKGCTAESQNIGGVK
jgi:hypothetical protein